MTDQEKARKLPRHEENFAFSQGWRDAIYGRKDDLIPVRWQEAYDRGWQARKDWPRS